MRLAELCLEAGFPPGVVNMLVGGADVGEAMVAHPGVDKIQFVGSGATAKKVLRSAADTLKPCGLELGGKSAVLRSEEHTSELQSLMRISYAVFCLKKKNNQQINTK